MDDGSAPGEVIELYGGAIHRREMVLEGNTFLHLLVEQRGIDVKVALSDAAGRVVREVDSPNGTEGPEEFVEIVPDAGGYSIEVTAWGSDDITGTVVYHELVRRPATDADRELVAADRSYHTLRKQIPTSPRLVIDGLEPVVELWRSRGLYRREADTLIPLCEAYLATSENRSALAACEQAIAWYRVFEAPHLLVGALRRAVIAHIRLGETDQAVRRAEEAIALARELGNPEDIGLGFQRLGEARSQQGDLQAALDAYAEALASIGKSRAYRGASIGRARARILLDLRRPNEALEALRDAAATYRRLDRPRKLALTLSTLTEAHIQLGDLKGAEQAARRAVELLIAHDDPRGRGLTLKTLGTVLRHREDLDGARRAFENALALFEKVEDPRSRAVVLIELGHLRFLHGDGAGALEHHEAAAGLFRKSGDLQGMATSRARGAQALAALGRLGEAWERLVPALDRVEEVRTETARSDFRLTYFAFRREYTRIAVDVAMELHAREPEAGWDARALAVNDRALARELVDAVAWPRVQPAADPRLSEEERALERQLRSLVAADPLGPSVRQRQIDAVLDQLHEVRGKMRQASGADRSVTMPELDVAAIQRLLGDRDLLLVYAFGETKSHLWSLTNRDRRVTALRPREAIEPWAREFVIGLQEDGDGEPGRRLWDLLIAPAAERLRGRQRLVIVADGALHDMPFAALPIPGTGREPGTERERYLLEEHEIVMLPSLATLVAHRRTRKAAPEGPAARGWLAVFADPIFTPDDPRLAAATPDASSGDALPAALERSLAAARRGASRGAAPERLPGTRDEADAIRARIGEERVRVFTGLEVDRQEVIASLSAYRIVHFATHGLSHPRPELSGLVLSLVDGAGRPRDGFLQTLEIARLNIAADLVVLSACETARGQEMDGEGVLGLAWGFFHAGTPRVVASLWQVGDTATARLMTRFYEHLDAGRAPSTALREAQLALADDPRATPYDWAGFVFQGDWQRPDWP